MTTLLPKALAIWLLIAVAEVLHGILRFRLLHHRVGDHRARQIGVFTGSAIILIITWFSVPWLGAPKTGQLLGVGLFWFVLRLAFEMGVGRWVLRASWQRSCWERSCIGSTTSAARSSSSAL